MYDGIEYGLALFVLFAVVFLFHALYAVYHQRSDTRLGIADSLPGSLDPSRPSRDRLNRVSVRRSGVAEPGERRAAGRGGKEEPGLHLRQPLQVPADWPRHGVAALTIHNVTVVAPAASSPVVARRLERNGSNAVSAERTGETSEVEVDADRIACRAVTTPGAVHFRVAQMSASLVTGHPIMVTAPAIDPKILRRTPPCALSTESLGPLDQVAHGLHIADGTLFQRPITCYGDVTIGKGCVIAAPMKVYGDLRAEQDVVFASPVTVNGQASLGRSCAFFSNVVVKGAIQASGPCIFGSEALPPVSVTSGSIAVGDGLFVNGMICTTEPAGLVCTAVAGTPRQCP